MGTQRIADGSRRQIAATLRKSFLMVTKPRSRQRASEDEAALVRDLVKKQKFPPAVKKGRFTIEFGEDSTGEPAVWIWFLVDDDLNPTKQKISELNHFANTVRSALLRAKMPYWPYVEFRAADADQLAP